MKSLMWHASVLMLTLCLSPFLSGQQTKVIESNGHLSPLSVKITFATDNTSRKVLLLGIGGDSSSFGTHQWGVRTEAGTTQRNLWLDNLGAIKGTHSLRRLTDELTVVLKDGKEFPVSFSYSLKCDKEIPAADPSDHYVCRYLYVKSEDDSSQKILRNVKSVEFLGPVRKDKAGNAMFDHWAFSPFTGEKLTAPAK